MSTLGFHSKTFTALPQYLQISYIRTGEEEGLGPHLI